jgi:ribosomal protein S18 acetylase RimI-like enzyme
VDAITTRLATAEEFDILTGLYLRAMRPLLTVERGTWDEGHEDARFRAHLDPAMTWVIERQGAVVGLYMLAELGGTEDVLYNLCVDPKHQRQGIGGYAVDRFLDRARARGHGAMLWVSKNNECAKRPYEALGFTVREENESIKNYVMRYTGQQG